jgi:hypothetical protein
VTSPVPELPIAVMCRDLDDIVLFEFWQLEEHSGPIEKKQFLEVHINEAVSLKIRRQATAQTSAPRQFK